MAITEAARSGANGLKGILGHQLHEALKTQPLSAPGGLYEQEAHNETNAIVAAAADGASLQDIAVTVSSKVRAIQLAEHNVSGSGMLSFAKKAASLEVDAAEAAVADGLTTADLFNVIMHAEEEEEENNVAKAAGHDEFALANAQDTADAIQVAAQTGAKPAQIAAVLRRNMEELSAANTDDEVAHAVDTGIDAVMTAVTAGVRTLAAASGASGASGESGAAASGASATASGESGAAASGATASGEPGAAASQNELSSCSGGSRCSADGLCEDGSACVGTHGTGGCTNGSTCSADGLCGDGSACVGADGTGGCTDGSSCTDGVCADSSSCTGKGCPGGSPCVENVCGDGSGCTSSPIEQISQPFGLMFWGIHREDFNGYAQEALKDAVVEYVNMDNAGADTQVHRNNHSTHPPPTPNRTHPPHLTSPQPHPLSTPQQPTHQHPGA
jgi:hypothetical protein